MPGPVLVARRRSRPRRWGVAVLGLVLVAVLAACQVQVEVDVIVDRNGAGTIHVAVGLDDAAVARVGGDLATELQVGDLPQAGWTVTGPAKEPDGLTWVRASKPFSNPDEIPAILGELAASDSFLRDVTFTKVETDDDITYRVTGQVDLTQGVNTFAEADVAAQLDGDPFGGLVAEIEAEEGKPVSEMISFEVTAVVAGSDPKTVTPTFTDTAPQTFDVSTVEVKPPPMLFRFALGAAAVVAVAVVVLALVGVRRRMHAR